MGGDALLSPRTLCHAWIAGVATALVHVGAIAAARAAPAAPITNGEPASDRAVVALAFGDLVMCTGTIVAPRAVLTAAHCVPDPSLPPGLSIVIGDPVTSIERFTPIARFVHPGFDPDTLDHDVAVVIVEEPLEPTPLAYATSLAGLVAGDTMRIVGYGWAVVDDPEPGQQRTGTSRIDAIDADVIRSSAAPSQVCQGDSGGPALHDDGGGEHIIGVTSSGDAVCTTFARHIRVDTEAAFITDVIARTSPGSAAPGARCWYEANCASGAACLPALDEPRWSFCAPPCGTNGTCPATLACITDEGGDARCRHPAPSPGALHAPCETNHDCAGELCLTPAGGDAPVCTRRCFSDLPSFACTGTDECRLASDGGEACFVPHVESSGCRATRGGGPLLALVLLLLAVTVQPRRAGSVR